MDLQKRADEIRSQMTALLDAAEAEGRGLTQEEREKYDAMKEERDGVLDLIERREAVRQEQRSERQPVGSEGPAGGAEERKAADVKVGEDREADRAFDSLGEQLPSVPAATASGTTR